MLQAGGLCVYNEGFGALTTVPDEYLQLQFDGVIGMGFVANISDNYGLPWFYDLVQNKSLDISKNPYFTFYLNGCVCVYAYYVFLYVCSYVYISVCVKPHMYS